MLKLGNIEFKYIEKNTKIGEIILNLVKELNDEKLEVKELDIDVIPLSVKFLTKNIFDVEYEGHSKLMIFINNDYELKLGMNSEGVLSLLLLKYLTKFLVEVEKRIKKYVEDLKDDEKKTEKIIDKDKENKDELAKLIGEIFLSILGDDIKNG